MSENRIRANKKCENCGHFVAERFCPHCGQENVEMHRRFHYLFVYFFKDFIHYDSQFWRTILSLMFRPAKLTLAYLDGKRKMYVPPIKLYIFISFLVFVIPAVLPDMDEEQHKGEKQQNLTSTENPAGNAKATNKTENVWMRTLDGIGDDPHKQEQMQEALVHHFPKAIFLYMPLFAFWLWVFHSKKKWLYFDHGIYTLHYFSFILLSALLYILADWLLSVFHREISDWISLAVFAYFIYYFFHSHRLMYRETKARSRTKCSLLFFINTLCMLMFLLLYLIVIVLLFADKSDFQLFGH